MEGSKGSLIVVCHLGACTVILKCTGDGNSAGRAGRRDLPFVARSGGDEGFAGRFAAAPMNSMRSTVMSSFCPYA